MKERYLETGKIVNTHGIAGEVKILPWADAPDFLLDFDTLYIDGKPVKLLAARVHKNCVLAKLEGVDDVNAAMRLRDKVVSIDREDVELEEGAFFLADIMGLEVRDADTGEALGGQQRLCGQGRRGGAHDPRCAGVHRGDQRGRGLYPGPAH